NLARSAVYEQQAFRWGDTVYGFQFHLEFTEPIIQRLASESQSQQYIADAGVDPKQLVAETPTRVSELAEAATEVFPRSFQHCGLCSAGSPCRARALAGFRCKTAPGAVFQGPAKSGA